jgi:lipoate-protein ligase B
MTMLNASHLGPTPYREGLRLQEALVGARAEGWTGDWLLFPDHPPVLTVGRGAAPGGLIADRATLERKGIEIFEVARGGDITWHGPGQLVGYAICDLTAHDRDLHRFLRALEAALMDVLGGYGIESTRVRGRTGVWVGERKIASLGIAVRRWVSYHGFALNVEPDLSQFDVIHPCGLRGVRMTSVRDQKGSAAPAFADVRERTTEAVARRLGYDGARRASREEVMEAAREAGASIAAR